MQSATQSFIAAHMMLWFALRQETGEPTYKVAFEGGYTFKSRRAIFRKPITL
jgi:hypothetical protein